jgi:hypothetical protein
MVGRLFRSLKGGHEEHEDMKDPEGIEASARWTERQLQND